VLIFQDFILKHKKAKNIVPQKLGQPTRGRPTSCVV
jgi:hypothetical protein